jgi:hypothetical protein
MNEEILAALEQKLAQHNRNQMTIDRMKQLNWKGRAMVRVMQVNWCRPGGIAAMLVSALFMLIALGAASLLMADEPQHIQCPDAGVKCKVIYLNAQEEQMLMTQNGILDTAAQGRALELGQFAVFLKTKIAAAAQGEVKQPPAPPAPPAPAAEQKPVDKPAE